MGDHLQLLIWQEPGATPCTVTCIDLSEPGATPCTVTCTLLAVPGATPCRTAELWDYPEASTLDASALTLPEEMGLWQCSEAEVRRQSVPVH